MRIQAAFGPNWDAFCLWVRATQTAARTPFRAHTPRPALQNKTTEKNARNGSNGCARPHITHEVATAFAFLYEKRFLLLELITNMFAPLKGRDSVRAFLAASPLASPSRSRRP